MKHYHILLFLIFFFPYCEQPNNYYQIGIYDDYRKAIMLSKNLKKNILVIFDVHGSAFDYTSTFLKDTDIVKLLRDDFVVVRLMCDDRKKNSTDSLTVGQVNRALQTRLLSLNVQPVYCVVDSNEQVKNTLFFTKDKLIFLNFLRTE